MKRKKGEIRSVLVTNTGSFPCDKVKKSGERCNFLYFFTLCLGQCNPCLWTRSGALSLPTVWRALKDFEGRVSLVTNEFVGKEKGPHTGCHSNSQKQRPYRPLTSWAELTPVRRKNVLALWSQIADFLMGRTGGPFWAISLSPYHWEMHSRQLCSIFQVERSVSTNTQST